MHDEEARELTMQLLDEEAWERGEILPVGRSVPVDEWLGQLAVWGMELSLPPLSRIASGPYDGGHVLVATGDVRLAFGASGGTVPAARLADGAGIHRTDATDRAVT